MAMLFQPPEGLSSQELRIVVTKRPVACGLSEYGECSPVGGLDAVADLLSVTREQLMESSECRVPMPGQLGDSSLDGSVCILAAIPTVLGDGGQHPQVTDLRHYYLVMRPFRLKAAVEVCQEAAAFQDLSTRVSRVQHIFAQDAFHGCRARGSLYRIHIPPRYGAN